MPEAIKVQRLSKRYRIGRERERYSRLSEAVVRGAMAPIRLLREGRTQTTDFWALRDVSFDIAQGEVVGIVGRNGAGKSTLLKVLSRITEPTSGHADVRGRVGSLLEVGTGFHPELTGRENIFLNGSILGMTRSEMDRKFEEIVRFSGVEQFLDTPVKRYSSGMSMRLAFAVAAHLEPDIFVVDEVLAVGDAAFQRKCLGKMQEVADGARTVLFVSHNMEAVLGLCSRAIWLDQGRVVADGHPDKIVREYLATGAQPLETHESLGDPRGRPGNGALRFRGVELRDARGHPVTAAVAGDPVSFVLHYDAPSAPTAVDVWFWVRDSFGRGLLCFSSYNTGADFHRLPPTGELVCEIPRMPLVPGRYSIDLAANVAGQKADRVYPAVTLEVAAGDFFGSGRPLDGQGALLCDHRWAAREAQIAVRRIDA